MLVDAPAFTHREARGLLKYRRLAVPPTWRGERPHVNKAHNRHKLSVIVGNVRIWATLNGPRTQSTAHLAVRVRVVIRARETVELVALRNVPVAAPTFAQVCLVASAAEAAILLERFVIMG